MIKDENKKKLTEELIDIFEKAKNEFLEKEKSIIKNDTNERTLTQRLAFYLELQLRKNIKYENYSVNCEYNKDGEDIKRLKFGKNAKRKKIYPDIIIHQVKEIEKLKALTDEKNGYCYVLGIYFELDITDNNNNIINFFVDGEEI